jgi:flavin reductase (DIM6/NTAB) family NADH-FMN oxidoreductase RutF
LLTGTIVPRPIAFISTKDEKGVDNLAPFSFYTGVTSAPPTVLFAISERKREKKDTLANIESRKQYVINVVTEEMAVPMHNSAADFRSEVSEFEETGFTPIPAKRVDCMAVKESPIHMECKLDQIIPVGRRTYIVLGNVVNFNIDDSLYLDSYKIDTQKMKPLARIGGPQYAHLCDFFKLDREFDPDKVKDSKNS